MKNQKNLYPVLGGIGKNLIWTSLIPNLCKKDGVDKISVMTPWPGLFNTNPQIEDVVPITDFQYYPELKKFDNIIFFEPYLSNYIKTEKMHILDAWAMGYGIESVTPQPILFNLIKEGGELSEQPTRPYCVVQFNGGGFNKAGENIANPREYRLDYVQKLLSKIDSQMDLDVICFRYKEEPKPSNTITYIDENPLGIIPIINKAEFVVTIDSALMHFAAVSDLQKKTIVLWNKWQTIPERIGYDFQTNLICETDVCIDIDHNIILNHINAL